MSAAATRRVMVETRTTTRTTTSSHSLPQQYPGRMKAISSEEMDKELHHVKEDQGKNVVMDTLAALVTDVNATAEILRRGQSRSPEHKPKEDRLIYHVREEVDEFPVRKAEARPDSVSAASQPDTYFSDSERESQAPLERMKGAGAVKVLPPEPVVEYKLRLTSPISSERSSSPTKSVTPFPSNRRRTPEMDERASVERVCQEFGIRPPADGMPDAKKRARSETPGSRRLIQVEGGSPLRPLPICAACGLEVKGPCITALAPNADRAMKFHPHHFVCTYCQKPLTLHGTYREHKRKPYCHECFYRLYSGHVYVVDPATKAII